MPSRSSRTRNSDRGSGSRSRSRSKNHHHSKRDANNASTSSSSTSSSSTTSSRKSGRAGKERGSGSQRHSNSRSHSHSHSHSDLRSTSRSASRSRSRSRSRPRRADKPHYRENAELPSDHPLFAIVSKQREQRKSSSRSPVPSHSRQHAEVDTHHNYRRTDYDERRSEDRRRRNRGDDDYYKDRRDHRHRDRDGERDRRRRDRDRERSGGHYKRRNREEYHRRDRDDYDETMTAKEDVENLHSKFELNFHTGHKQQVLKKKKKEEIEQPQITAAQAQEIIAVTSMVQQQEQISEIVETQQRKMKQKTSLEKVKEKILLQKQQMLARRKQQQAGTQHSSNSSNDGGSNHHKDVETANNAAVFVNASQLNASLHKEALLPNMTGMMHENDPFHLHLIPDAQRKAIENLAAFVKEHGCALEQTVRDRSRNDSKFSWLYDETSSGYLYYQHLLKPQATQQPHAQNSNVAATTATDSSPAANGSTTTTRRRRRRFSARPTDKEVQQHNNNNNVDNGHRRQSEEDNSPRLEQQSVATSASTKRESNDTEQTAAMNKTRQGFSEQADENEDKLMHGVLATNSLDEMNAFVTKLEHRDRAKKETRYDRANQMSIFNGGSSHHIGHYLPEDQLNKFNEASAHSKMPREHDRNHRLRHTNKGHVMLKKLGWNEGQGLGRNKQGDAIPVSSRIHKKDTNSGIGTNDSQGRKPWDPTPDDDQFALYKKKMMLAYRYRPNPLNNPRKDYY